MKMLNRMKKTFVALLTLAMLLGCAPVLADSPIAAAACRHYWTRGDVILPPTCEDTGIALKVCLLCKEISTDYYTISTTAHDYSIPAQVITAASCTADGRAVYACSVCGAKEAYARRVPATGHSYGEAGWIEATCTTNAQYGQTCANCGDRRIQYQTPGSALGHDIREIIVAEASCAAAGRSETRCTRCDVITPIVRVIPKLPHSYRSYNTLPGCTEPGLIGTLCTVCGAELGTVTRIPAKGHMLVVQLPVEPDCTTPGLSVGEYCSVCGEISQPQVAVPAKGHNYVVQLPVEPSCTESGLSIGEYCETCGEISQPQEVIPAKGHSAVAIPGKPADCANTGLTEGSRCAVCGLVLVKQQTIPALDHDWQLSNNGRKYICEACGEEISAKPTAVSIDAPLSMELDVGDTLTLDVIYSPRDSFSPVSWSSSNKKVVSIDEDGFMEALKEGSATITVRTENGKKDTLKLKVVDPYKPTKVELDASGTIILAVGDELQLDAIVYPETAETTLEWDCSSSRCTVDEDGFVTAIRTGTATITVETENGKKDSVSIRVVKADEPYSVTLSESGTIFLAVGEEMQLEAEILPASADTELKWSSSSSRCAVDEDGWITGVRTGTATITVRTENGKKDTVKVEVY